MHNTLHHRRVASAITRRATAQRVLLFVCVAFTRGCSSGAAANVAEELPVRVEGQRLILRTSDPQLASLQSTVVEESAPDSLRLPGRLAWDEDVTVRVFSPFAGRVLGINTDVGRRVQRGETLARITAPDFGQAQSDVRRASADLALAERSAARVRDLVQHGIAAQKDVEGAEADLARARAEQQRTQSRLSLYGGDTSAVNQVFALRAPLGGMVVERSITPGQEVRPDQMLANSPQLFAPLFVVTDPSRLWVMMDVPERDLHLVQAGTAIEIHTNAWSNRVFKGRVTLVAGSVDPSSHTVKVRGTVSDPLGLLKAEMLMTATVPGRYTTGVAVPTSAVLLEDGAHIVYIEESRGRLRRVPIEVGAEHDGVIPVLSGLESGQRVVTAGAILAESLFQSGAHS